MPDYIVEAVTVVFGYMMMVFAVLWFIDWVAGLLRGFGND
jgi:hypothetical protein